MAIITVEIEVFASIEEIIKTERDTWFVGDKISIDENYLTTDPTDDSFHLYTLVGLRDN